MNAEIRGGPEARYPVHDERAPGEIRERITPSWGHYVSADNHQLGTSLVGLGLCLTVAAALGALGVSRTGPLIDRFGARNALVATAVVRAAIFAAYPLVHHLWVFAVLATVVALANRTDQTAGQAIVSGLASEETRPRWFGLSRMTLNLGIGGGSLIGGLLLGSPSGYTWLVLVNAAAFAVVAVIYLALPSIVVHVPERESSAGVWKDRLFVKVAAMNGLWMVIALAVEVGLPVYLVLFLHQPAWTVSVVFAVNTAMVALFQLPVARMVQGHPPMRLFALGLIIYGASFLAFLAAGAFRGPGLLIGLVVGVAVFTTAEMLVAVTGMTVVNGLAPADRTGAYIGLSWMFAGVGSALAPTVFTAALEVSPSALWVALAVLAAVLVPVTLRLQAPVEQRMRELSTPAATTA